MAWKMCRSCVNELVDAAKRKEEREEIDLVVVSVLLDLDDDLLEPPCKFDAKLDIVRDI